jgi:hypothetical protein
VSGACPEQGQRVEGSGVWCLVSGVWKKEYEEQRTKYEDKSFTSLIALCSSRWLPPDSRHCSFWHNYGNTYLFEWLKRLNLTVFEQ